MNVMVYTAASDVMWPIMQLTAANRMEYCMRHGYQLVFGKNINFAAFPEQRAARTYEYLHQCDWLLFMGIDTCFTNMNIKVEDIVEKYKPCDLIIAEDIHGINNDVMLLRNCQPISNLIATVAIDLKSYMNEQFALDCLLKNNTNYSYVKVHQRVMNSMPYELYGYPDDKGGKWQKGDWIFHAAGLDDNTRMRIMSEKLKEVVR